MGPRFSPKNNKKGKKEITRILGNQLMYIQL